MSVIDTTARPTRATHDVRGFWRVLLAVIAPVPMLSMGLGYVLSPIDGDAPFDQTVSAVRADPTRFELLQWLQTPLFLLVPAVLAVVLVTRRAAPRLTTAGGLVALVGLSLGFYLLPGVATVEYVAVTNDLDLAGTARLVAAVEDQPTILLGGLAFILAITIGLLLLGIALWRSKTAPAWTGIALALGGFTHPFIPGHVAAGIGLGVAAVGFAGASVALLRMTNDQFDLPPARTDRSDGRRAQP